MNLLSRQIVLGSSKGECDVCVGHVELVDHLFILCEVVYVI